MRKIQCIIKVTNGCNLRCKYCYNADKQFDSKIISLDKIERVFSLFSNFDCIQVIFHGGEPMLAGIGFYEKVMELENRLAIMLGVTFENQIQTNATLIDSRWLAFVKKNNIAIGVSFDGLYNDDYRGETKKVLKSVEILKKNDVKFGCLTVVADPNYNIAKNYEYFQSLGLGVDFNCVFMEGNAKSLNKVIDANSYTKQMVELFDRWIYDLDGIPVRGLDFIIKRVLNCSHAYCRNGSCIGHFFCLDVDGTLYGCGRESVKKYSFGNVNAFNSFHDIINSENFKLYIKGSIERRNNCSAHCQYFEVCKGGCNDDAILGGDITKPNSDYCKYFITLFSHIKEKIDEIFKNRVDLASLNPYFTKALIQATSVNENDSI